MLIIIYPIPDQFSIILMHLKIDFGNLRIVKHDESVVNKGVYINHKTNKIKEKCIWRKTLWESVKK